MHPHGEKRRDLFKKWLSHGPATGRRKERREARQGKGKARPRGWRSIYRGRFESKGWIPQEGAGGKIYPSRSLLHRAQAVG